jgi:hypothetical protein
MRWLLQKLDDEKMDTFLNGLPGYIHSPLTDTRLLIEGLKEDGVPWRIRDHFMTCVTSVELSDEASMSRASACINALLLITDTSASTIVEQAGSETNDIQPLMEHLEPFCYIPNSSTALRALCVRGLAIREFLVFLADLDAEELFNQKFPNYFTPLTRSSVCGKPQKPLSGLISLVFRQRPPTLCPVTGKCGLTSCMMDH